MTRAFQAGAAKHSSTVPQSGESKKQDSATSPPKQVSGPKNPIDMLPEELIEYRRHDPNGWDAFTTTNSVAAFALSKPTDEEKARAQQKVKAKKWKRLKLPFDSKISTISIPAGEDFKKGERRQTKTAKISFAPDPNKK